MYSPEDESFSDLDITGGRRKPRATKVQALTQNLTGGLIQRIAGLDITLEVMKRLQGNGSIYVKVDTLTKVCSPSLRPWYVITAGLTV